MVVDHVIAWCATGRRSWEVTTDPEKFHDILIIMLYFECPEGTPVPPRRILYTYEFYGYTGDGSLNEHWKQWQEDPKCSSCVVWPGREIDDDLWEKVVAEAWKRG